MTANRRNILLPVLTSLTFAGSFVAGKYAMADLAPLTATFLRYVVAVAFLSAIIALKGRSEFAVRRADIGRLVLLGLLGVVGYHYFFFASLRHTVVANTAIINAFSPVVTGILAAFFIRERLTGKNYFGVFLATIGVLILVTRGSLDRLMGLDFNLGDGLMFLAVLNWAVYALIVRKLSKRYSGLTITWYSAVFGLILLTFLIMAESPAAQIRSMPLSTMLATLYMGAVASGIGYMLYSHSIQAIGPTRTSSLVHSILPVFVAILALLFFGEDITTVMVISIVLIVVGLNFVLARRR